MAAMHHQRTVAPLPSSFTRTTRARSRAGTSTSPASVSVPAFYPAVASSSTYVPMEPLTPSLDDESAFVPSTPALSRSLAGTKRKTSDVEDQQQLSRSTRRKADLSQSFGSPTPGRVIRNSPGKRALFASVPASVGANSSVSAPSWSTYFPLLDQQHHHHHQQQQQIPSLPTSGPAYGYNTALFDVQQQQQLAGSVPGASAMELSLSVPAPSSSSIYSQDQVFDPSSLYAPAMVQASTFPGSAASASGLDDGALSAYGATYPASAPAYFDWSGTELFCEPQLAQAQAGEGIWPPPPTAAAPAFSQATEMMPLQSVATLLPDFAASMQSTPPSKQPQPQPQSEEMALFASQVRRQAEKLTLADEDASDDDGSEYKLDGEDIPVIDDQYQQSPTKGRTQGKKAGSMSRSTSKEGASATPSKKASTSPSKPRKPDSRSSHNKPPATGIPRPKNAWILFRSHVFSEMRAGISKGTQQRDLSKTIAEMWKNLGKEDKEKWGKEAEEEARKHREMYPDYRYNPNKNRTPAKSAPSANTLPPIDFPFVPSSSTAPFSIPSKQPLARSSTTTSSTPSRRARTQASSTVTYAQDDIPVPVFPSSSVFGSPSKSSLAMAKLHSTVSQVGELASGPLSPTTARARVRSAAQVPATNALRQTIRKGDLGHPQIYPALSAPVLPAYAGPARTGTSTAKLDFLNAPPPLAQSATGNARRTGSHIKNIRSLPASVHACETTLATPAIAARRVRTPIGQHRPAPASSPRYQLPTAASLAKSTSGARIPSQHQQQLRRQPSLPTALSLPRRLPQAQYAPVPAAVQQYSQYGELHSPRPISGTQYQTVDQLLRSVGISEQGEREARGAAEYFNASHGLAWLDPESMTHAQSEFEQQKWRQSTAPSVSAAAGDRYTPGTGLVDGIVVNGIHYEVQNTEALLEDIRSGKFGGPVPAPVSAAPSAALATGGLRTATEDVFLGSGMTPATSHFGEAEFPHSAAATYQPETPTSAFLRLGPASAQQYLLAPASSRNISSGTYLLTPHTGGLATSDSLQTMPQTPTLYISEYGARAQRHEDIDWMPGSRKSDQNQEEVLENSTGSIIIHPDPEEEEEEQGHGTIVDHGKEEEEEQQSDLIVPAAKADTSFGSAESGQWATYA